MKGLFCACTWPTGKAVWGAAFPRWHLAVLDQKDGTLYLANGLVLTSLFFAARVVCYGAGLWHLWGLRCAISLLVWCHSCIEILSKGTISNMGYKGNLSAAGDRDVWGAPSQPPYNGALFCLFLLGEWQSIVTRVGPVHVAPRSSVTSALEQNTHRVRCTYPRRLPSKPLLDASHPEGSDASAVPNKATQEAGLRVHLTTPALRALIPTETEGKVSEGVPERVCGS